MRIRVLLLTLLTAGLFAQQRPPSCDSCPASWNTQRQPFKIYGNTYYVGTEGLSSLLITSESGHVLIDGALPESAPLIAASIRSLGFRVGDVKLIVNSHAHFDHAGGIAELQRLSGARVAASPWTAKAMLDGAVPRDDPQWGAIVPIAKVANVQIIRSGQTLTAGAVSVTAHWTPGHTPGGTSWTWRSCEGVRCLDLVYADSLTPVSAEGFLFSHGEDYPNVLDDFERSYSFLESTPCHILITPHPEQANLNAADRGDDQACKDLAARSRERLKIRLAAERERRQ